MSERAVGLRGRISRGHLLMVVLGLAGVAASTVVLRHREGGVRIEVAAHDIRAGDLVTAADLRPEAVTATPALLSTLLRSSDASGVGTRVAAASIAEGEPVARRALRPRGAPRGLRAMSIPIDPSRAVSGRLAPGDRVDVLVAGDRSVSIIVAAAEVLAVDVRSRGGIGQSASPFTVTIAVDVDESERVAAALAQGTVSIARSTGAPPATGRPPLAIDRTSGAVIGVTR